MQQPLYYMQGFTNPTFYLPIVIPQLIISADTEYKSNTSALFSQV